MLPIGAKRGTPVSYDSQNIAMVGSRTYHYSSVIVATVVAVAVVVAAVAAAENLVELVEEVVAGVGPEARTSDHYYTIQNGKVHLDRPSGCLPDSCDA